MSWNGALEGFVKGFSTGYDMVRSPDEREFDELTLKEKRYKTSDAYLDLQRRADEADIGYKEAEKGRLGLVTEGLRYEQEPAQRARKAASEESETGLREASTRHTLSEAEKIDLANQKEKKIQKAIQDNINRMLKRRGATPLDESTEPAPGPAPGPQSAVDTGETPTVSMSTYSPPEDEVPASDPEASGEAVPAQAQAVSTEPVADKTGARVDTQGRAYDLVDEQQGQVAGIRKQPLDPATRDVLQHAGQQTGIRSVVYSGGQVGKGEDGPRTGSTRHDHGMAADVRLYDAQTGRLLDMRDPEDAERMKAFGAAAVQAGATGIGAGEGYMGPSSMHIGFGKEASWGGASWIEDARLAGVEARASMPEPGARRGAGAGARGKGEKGLIDNGHEAVKLGLMAIAEAAGLNQDQAVSTPESQQAINDMLTGEHAADEDQVKATEEVVNNMAGGDLSDAEIPLYTLAATWQAYTEAGMPEEAQKAAQGLLGHYQKMYAQYGAMAQAAAAQGDIPEAIELAVRAYANVPDGNELEVRALEVPRGEEPKYEVIIKDISGKVKDRKTIMTPDEIAGMAMEINPANFPMFIAQAAGVRASEGKGATTGGKDGGIKLEERNRAVELVDDAVTKYQEAHPEQAELLHFDDPQLSVMEDLRPITEQIVLTNDIPPERALRAVINIIDNGPGEGGIKDLGDGNVEIRMRGIDPFVMSADDYAVLAANRNKLRGEAGPAAPSKGAGIVRDALGRMGGPAVPVTAPARTPQAPTAPLIPEWLTQQGPAQGARSGPGVVNPTPRVEPRELMRRAVQ